MTVIAVSSAGRRRYVIEELLRTSRDGDVVIVLDRDPHAPALAVPGARGVITHGMTLNERLDTLQSLGVDAIVSLHDYETIELATDLQELRTRGIRFIGPDREAAIVALDKLLLAKHVARTSPEWAVPTYPASSVPDSVDGPLVLKDRYGSGSSGLLTVEDRLDARRRADSRRASRGWHPSGELRPVELVAQPFLTGTEMNIDLFFDAHGKLTGHCIKTKLRMRDGETDSAVIHAGDTDSFVPQVAAALSGLRLSGNIDVDIMREGSNFKILDVNPRFGGGYAFSVLAGYGAAEGIWTLARGEEVQKYFRAHRSLTASKYLAVSETID